MKDILRALCLGVLLLASNQAMAVSTAATSSFYVDWSGAEHNNTAEAHGWLTVYEGSQFSSTAEDKFLMPFEDVVDFSITVSGASSGNGTFGLSDFETFMWSTKALDTWPDDISAEWITYTEVGIDLSREVVGQATSGGPWGSNHSSEAEGGEFNLFALNLSAPNTNAAAFQIATNGGNGDVLNLTSFRPVPLPAAFWLFGPALLGLSRVGFKRQALLA